MTQVHVYRCVTIYCWTQYSFLCWYQSPKQLINTAISSTVPDSIRTLRSIESLHTTCVCVCVCVRVIHIFQDYNNPSSTLSLYMSLAVVRRNIPSQMNLFHVALSMHGMNRSFQLALKANMQYGLIRHYIICIMTSRTVPGTILH